jgi:hypothetical protein
MELVSQLTSLFKLSSTIPTKELYFDSQGVSSRQSRSGARISNYDNLLSLCGLLSNHNPEGLNMSLTAVDTSNPISHPNTSTLSTCVYFAAYLHLSKCDH